MTPCFTSEPIIGLPKVSGKSGEAQIAQYDLPTKPRKSTERRRLDIEHTVEAEAMPAGLLRRMLRDKIESFLPAGALAAAKVAEESERE